MKLLKSLIQLFLFVLKLMYKLPFIGYYFDLYTLTLSTIARFASGHWCASNLENCARPKLILKLYEFEGCPFCKKVREALSVLDLDCIIYPCPRETFKKYGFVSKQSKFRGEVLKIGGKLQFPFLVDENKMDKNGNIIKLYESNKIIEYLWSTYGSNAKSPPTYYLGSYFLNYFTFLLLLLFSSFRCLPEHGIIRYPNKKPIKVLELWSFEPSPYCKKVREVLSCLEIPYILRNAARGSLKRKEFKQRFYDNGNDKKIKISKMRQKIGLIQVPLLIDPNTGIELIESEDIKQYLLQQYKTGECVNESLADYGTEDNNNNNNGQNIKNE